MPAKSKKAANPHRHKGFYQLLSEIDVRVSRNIEFVRVTDTGEVLDDTDICYMTEYIKNPSIGNRTEDYSRCLQELKPLTQNLNLVLFNLESIVEILVRYLSKPDTMAAEPILMLIAALARDVRAELMPHFKTLFSVMVDVLNAAIPPQKVALVEACFQGIAFLLKYLARYVASDLPTFLDTFSVLLCHKKIYVSHFACETLAFIIRRLRAGRLEDAVEDIFSLLRNPKHSPKELEALAHSLSAIFGEAVKGVQKGFHSQTQPILKCLLESNVHNEDLGAWKPQARAAQLSTVKVTLLRMRDHAGELDSHADILETVLDNCRKALKRLSEVQTVEAGERSYLPAEQEIMFYVDLLVEWARAKPKPAGNDTSWGAYSEAVLEVLAAALPLARQHRGCPAAEDTAELRFPPAPLPMAEVAVRAAGLLWRALPKVVGKLCDTELAQLLMGQDPLDVLNCVSASVLPTPFKGLASSPLLQLELDRTIPLIGGSDEMSASAMLLCARLLQAAGATCFSTGALGDIASRSSLLERLLMSAEASSEPRLAIAPVHCVRTLLQEARGTELQTLEGKATQIAARLAALVPREHENAEGPRVALVRSQLLLAAVLACLEVGGKVQGGPAEAAWPCGTFKKGLKGTPAWVAWVLAWASAEPSQPSLLRAARDALKALSPAGSSLLATAELGPALAACRRAAVSESEWLRISAVELASLVPASVALQQVSCPDGQSTEKLHCEEEVWPALEAEDQDVPETAQEVLDQLFEVSQRLVKIEVCMETDRERSTSVIRVAKAIRELPLGAWAGMLGCQVIFGQYFVRFSPGWKAAQEALLLLASSSPITTEIALPSRKVKRRKKASKGEEKAAEPAEPAESAPAEQAEDAAEEAGGKKKKRKRGGRQESAQPEGELPKKRRREEEEDDELLSAELVQEMPLDEWLRPASAPADVDWSEAGSQWWWGEVVWAQAQRFIVTHEMTNDEEMETKRPGELPDWERKDKHAPWKVRIWSASTANEAPLWRGSSSWQEPLERAWDELEGEETAPGKLKVHEQSWTLVQGLLEQNHWRSSGALEPWQKDLRIHHNNWVLAKFLHHLRSRYGTRGRPGSRSCFSNLINSLTCVAAMPSIEVCAKPLVSLCIHSITQWLLPDRDPRTQELAVTVLARCRRRLPHITACEDSLKLLCDDYAFRNELTLLNAAADGKTVEEETVWGEENTDKEAAKRGAALYEHRVELLPSVLRLLFAKANKGGRALNRKVGKKEIRRSKVFAYLSSLVEPSTLPELLQVLIGTPLMAVLVPQAGGDPKDLKATTVMSSVLRKTNLVRQFLAFQSDDDGQHGWVWSNTTCEDLGADDSVFYEKGPVGWVWTDPSSQNSYVLEPFAESMQLLSYLQQLEFVLPQFIGKLDPYATFIARTLATILGRVGQLTSDYTTKDIPSTSKRIQREVVTRIGNLLDKYMEKLPSMTAALKPVSHVLDRFFEMLPRTTGAVTKSAIVSMAVKWSKEPGLFGCFQDLCPNALSSIFKIPGGSPVRAMVTQTNGNAGAVVPVVGEIALRLCQGGVLDPEERTTKRSYARVRREGKKKKRFLQGDSSEEEEGVKELELPGDELLLNQEEEEELKQKGIAILKPHVDVLLSSMQKLVALRASHREANPELFMRPRSGFAKRKRRRDPMGLEQRGPSAVVTLVETKALAAIAEFSTDTTTSQQLVDLLLTALNSGVQGKAHVSADVQNTTVLAMRRLVHIAVPAAVAEIKEAAAAAPEPAARPNGKEASGRKGLEPANMKHMLTKILGAARDVALRAHVGELLVDFEAILLLGRSAKDYLAAVEALPLEKRWQPGENAALAAHWKGGFSELHVAHLVAALNAMRKSSLAEPDIDQHVDTLNLLCDHHLLPSAGGEKADVIPAATLPPMLQHLLFMLHTEGVDLGVLQCCERAVCSVADRLTLAAKGVCSVGDELEMRSTLFSLVIPSLRKLLRAPMGDLYRVGLRVLAHMVRTLAPHAAYLDGLKQNGKASVSAPSLLHADLLPFLKDDHAQKQDDGGDLFVNLLHFQKHRRGRGLTALGRAALAGQLTSATLTHFVLPLAMQGLMQRNIASGYDQGLADMSTVCLKNSMPGVSWGTCLTTVRYLSSFLCNAKQEKGREVKVVRATCDILSAFPFPKRELPTPDQLVFEPQKWEEKKAVKGKEKKAPAENAELEEDEVELPDKEVQEKLKEKSKGKGKGPRGVARGNFARNLAMARFKKSEAAEQNPAASDVEQDAEPLDKAGEISKALKKTVMPLLTKMVWQEAPKKAGNRLAATSSQKKASGGLVRIAVISVMIHCVANMQPEDFLLELPNVLGMAITGLKAKEINCRRAARAAVQSIASTLGPKWLGWIVKEMREQLDKSYTSPVCTYTVLSALQAVEAKGLQCGDLDPAFSELTKQVFNELGRALDASKPDAEQDETQRAGQILEGKTLKGPAITFIASKYASPALVCEHIFKLERRLRGELIEEAEEQYKLSKKAVKARKQMGGKVPLRPQTMLHLNRVETLMQRASAGLLQNSGFTMSVEATFVSELLTSTLALLEGFSAGAKLEDPSKSKPKSVDDDDYDTPFVMPAARSREEHFAIQPGAAIGRSVGLNNCVLGRSAAQTAGFDAHACAGTLGVVGLGLLKHFIKTQKAAPAVVEVVEPAEPVQASMAEGVTEQKSGKTEIEECDIPSVLRHKIVPAVVTCFCSKQDKLFNAAAKCLALLRGYYAEQPEVLSPHGAEIAKKVLMTFELMVSAPNLSQHLRAKASLRGLSTTGAAGTLAICTRLLSALLNSRSSVDWFLPLAEEPRELPKLLGTQTSLDDMEEQWKVRKKAGAAAPLERSTFFDALLLHIRAALEQQPLQASALQLLRRVLLRNRVLTFAVYQTMDAVAEVMITGGDRNMSRVCAHIYVDFMLDYPHEDQAIQNRLNMLARNMGYVDAVGRRSVLNCLYLVILHFPQEALEHKWSNLLFLAAAVRLPQEPDAMAHRMLHVLIRSLFSHVTGAGRRRMLELAIPWASSPKRPLHVALGECVGLMAEAGGPGLVHLVESSLPALHTVLQASLRPQAASSGEPWRAAYAASKAFERMLAAMPLDALERMLTDGEKAKADADETERKAAEDAAAATAAAEEPRKPKVKGKKRRRLSYGDEEPPNVAWEQERGDGAVSSTAPAAARSLSPGEALRGIWDELLGGRSEAFAAPERHGWVVSVAMRILEAQLVRCTREQQARIWLFPSSTSGAKPVDVGDLLRGMEGLLGSDRLERETSLAPLVVRALRALMMLLLRCPELTPEDFLQTLHPEEKATAKAEVEVVEDAAEGQEDSRMEAAEGEREEERREEDPEKAPKKKKKPQEEAEEEKTAEDEEQQLEEAAKREEEADEGEEAQEKREMEEREAEEQAEAEKDAAEVAVSTVEGSRMLPGESIFEEIGSLAGHLDTREDSVQAELAAEPEVTSVAAAPVHVQGDVASVLQRSRVRWLMARLAYRLRGYLSRPNGYIRLVSILRLWESLITTLEEEVLADLCGTMLNPLFRCSTCVPRKDISSLDVQSMQQILALSRSDRMQYVSQLAQSMLNTLSHKLHVAGFGSAYAQGLAKVRKDVEDTRVQRAAERKLKAVQAPQEFAADKLARNRRNSAKRARNREEERMMQTDKEDKRVLKLKKPLGLV